MFRKLVRNRRNHQQPQRAGASAALPQSSLQLFIFHQSSFAPEINLDLLPREVLLLAHLFGREYFLIVFATPTDRRGKAKPGILAAASQQLGAISLSAEHGFVTEAPVTHHQQQTARSASAVQALAQALQQRQ